MKKFWTFLAVAVPWIYLVLNLSNLVVNLLAMLRLVHLSVPINLISSAFAIFILVTFVKEVVKNRSFKALYGYYPGLRWVKARAAA